LTSTLFCGIIGYRLEVKNYMNTYKVTTSLNGIKQPDMIVSAKDKSGAIEEVWALVGFQIIIDEIEEVVDSGS